MSDDLLDPAAELAWIAAQARGQLELDRLLGVPAALVPTLPALAPAPRPVAAPLATATPTAPTAPAPPGDEDPAALAARRRDAEARLDALARRMAGCTKCRLSEGRNQLVFGQGDAAAEVAFVGEGPGYHEDQEGLAFVGKAGELLTKMIKAMGLERDEVFIANVVKCRPPGNRTPAPDEMGTCLPFLQEQLEIVRPKVICALGKTAAVGLGLIAPDEALGRSRGRFRDWRGTPVMITYHPAYLLRTPADKRKAWEDLQQLFPLIARRRAT
ncbi:MAG: uracil-DNA glycosylase [Planctomycetes bacterium]|nr:uracil-DNA glycosylase [Planctomycetota bacterium]